MFSRDLYLDALSFAATAHGSELTNHGLPYIIHSTAVANEVMATFRLEPGYDEDLAIVCALLHDVLEDTECTREEIEARFGARVLAGVEALTKNPALPPDVQIPDSLRRILEQPVEIAIVKMADRTSNLGPPPPDWDRERIAAYKAMAERIYDTLAFASPDMASRLRERIDTYPPSR
jgi:(p)ppGpp synthase/HD superfamily hydrolase